MFQKPEESKKNSSADKTEKIERFIASYCLKPII